MIDVHVSRTASGGRTLANPELDHNLLRAKMDWLLAVRELRATLDAQVIRGAWPVAISAKLQHWVTQVSEAEARINELVMVDIRLSRLGLISTKGR